MMRQRALKAQAKITKMISFLDQAFSSLNENEIDREEEILSGTANGDDDDSIDDIPKVPAELFLASGKKQLQGAQSDLRKAMKRWDDDILL